MGQIGDKTNLSDGIEVSPGTIEGYNSALRANVFLSQRVFIETGAGYYLKGSRERISVTVMGERMDFDATYHLEYLEVPLGIGISGFDFAHTNYTVRAGVFASFFSAGEYELVSHTLIIEGFTQKLEDVSAMDFGYYIGGRLMLARGKLPIFVAFEYAVGLVELELPTFPGQPNAELKNHGLSLAVGFELPFRLSGNEL